MVSYCTYARVSRHESHGSRKSSIFLAFQRHDPLMEDQGPPLEREHPPTLLPEKIAAVRGTRGGGSRTWSNRLCHRQALHIFRLDPLWRGFGKVSGLWFTHQGVGE